MLLNPMSQFVTPAGAVDTTGEQPLSNSSSEATATATDHAVRGEAPATNQDATHTPIPSISRTDPSPQNTYRQLPSLREALLNTSSGSHTLLLTGHSQSAGKETHYNQGNARRSASEYGQGFTHQPNSPYGPGQRMIYQSPTQAAGLNIQSGSVGNFLPVTNHSGHGVYDRSPVARGNLHHRPGQSPSIQQSHHCQSLQVAADFPQARRAGTHPFPPFFGGLRAGTLHGATFPPSFAASQPEQTTAGTSQATNRHPQTQQSTQSPAYPPQRRLQAHLAQGTAPPLLRAQTQYPAQPQGRVELQARAQPQDRARPQSQPTVRRPQQNPAQDRPTHEIWQSVVGSIQRCDACEKRGRTGSIWKCTSVGCAIYICEPCSINRTFMHWRVPHRFRDEDLDNLRAQVGLPRRGTNESGPGEDRSSQRDTERQPPRPRAERSRSPVRESGSRHGGSVRQYRQRDERGDQQQGGDQNRGSNLQRPAPENAEAHQDANDREERSADAQQRESRPCGVRTNVSVQQQPPVPTDKPAPPVTRSHETYSRKEGGRVSTNNVVPQQREEVRKPNYQASGGVGLGLTVRFGSSPPRREPAVIHPQRLRPRSNAHGANIAAFSHRQPTEHTQGSSQPRQEPPIKESHRGEEEKAHPLSEVRDAREVEAAQILSSLQTASVTDAPQHNMPLTEGPIQRLERVARERLGKVKAELERFKDMEKNSVRSD